MSKKLLILLGLSLLLLTALIGCGQQPADEPIPTAPPSPSPVPQPTPAPAPTPEPSTTPEPETPTTTIPISEPLTVLSISEGSIYVMKAGTDDWVDGEVEMTLDAGDSIKTGYYSQAEITFFEGSTIELESGSQINIVELDVEEDTGSTSIVLQQEVGKTISRVEKLVDTASRYEVELPGGVAAVRGSILVAYVYEDGRAIVYNQEGSISVIAQGVEVKIPEGKQSTVIPGKEPTTPIPPPDEGDGHVEGEDPIIAGIEIVKMADLIQVHDGDTVTYTYNVTNPGNTSLTNISVTDDIAGEAAYVGGDTDGDGRLDPGETWTFETTYITHVGNESPLVNIATASGNTTIASGVVVVVEEEASASVDILRPDISIDKSADPDQARSGANITYTFVVTNTGNTELSEVAVEDSLTGNPAYVSGDINTDSVLDLDETWVYTASYVMTEVEGCLLTNNATASGVDVLELEVNGADSAEVAVLYDVTIISNGCCPVNVSYAGTNDTVPACSNKTYSIPCGTEMTVTADDSDALCEFVSWSNGGERSHSIVVDSDISLTANCRRLFGISQGDNTWIVNPLSNNQTCEEFFSYGDWESNTGLEQSDTSLIFLWDGPDGLSLVIIHDTWEDDGSGGAVRFEFIGLPGEGSWVVQNDPDNFDSATDTDVQWSWSAEHNDGGVFRGGLDGTFEITIIPGFNVGVPLEPGEITAWKLVTGDLNSPTQYVLDMSENLTISDSISA